MAVHVSMYACAQTSSMQKTYFYVLTSLSGCWLFADIFRTARCTLQQLPGAASVRVYQYSFFQLQEVLTTDMMHRFAGPEIHLAHGRFLACTRGSTQSSVQSVEDSVPRVWHLQVLRCRHLQVVRHRKKAQA